MTPANIIHYIKLKGFRFRCGNPKLIIEVDHQQKEKKDKRDFYVSPGAMAEGVRQIVIEVAGDKRPEVFQLNKSGTDNGTFLCHPKKQIPHYINLKFAKTGRRREAQSSASRCLVTLRRRQSLGGSVPQKKAE